MRCLIALCLLATNALAGDVVWYLKDAQGAVQANRQLLIFKLEVPTNTFKTNLITRERIVKTTDATGYAILTNYTPGIYRTEHQGTQSPTTNYYLFPVTNGTIYAADPQWKTAPTNVLPYHAYTTDASDARYLRYANPFSSPGSGANSEQFGATSSAPGLNSLAVGYDAFAPGVNSTALGNGAGANLFHDTAIGGNCEVAAGGGTGVGQSVVINATNGTALGCGADVEHAFSTAIGANATTTAANQVRLGTSAETVSIPGNVQIKTISVMVGAGSPESAVTAPVGSLYLRTDGSTSTTLYVKTTGTGATGWTAK